MGRRLKNIWLLLVFVFLYAPLVVMIAVSFSSGDSTTQITGLSLRWYREMLHDQASLKALKNTLILSGLSALISTAIGSLAAYGIFHMQKRRVRSLVMTVTNIPMMNPDIVTGISLMLLFVFTGSLLGRESYLSFYTLLIAHISFDLPYVILSVLPKLKQMDPHISEAAMDLGCTSLQSFFRVELPSILPGIATGFLMAFTMSFDDFVISNFTSGSSFETLTIHIYSMVKKSVKPNIYALSTLLFALIFVLLLIYNFASGRDDRIKSAAGAAEKFRQKRLHQERGEAAR